MDEETGREEVVALTAVLSELSVTTKIREQERRKAVLELARLIVDSPRGHTIQVIPEILNQKVWNLISSYLNEATASGELYKFGRDMKIRLAQLQGKKIPKTDWLMGEMLNAIDHSQDKGIQALLFTFLWSLTYDSWIKDDDDKKLRIIARQETREQMIKLRKAIERKNAKKNDEARRRFIKGKLGD